MPGHDVIIHDKAAADVIDDGLGDGEAVALVGGDGFGVLLVDVQGHVLRAEFAGFGFAMFQQSGANALAVMLRQEVKFVQFDRAGFFRWAE